MVKQNFLTMASAGSGQEFTVCGVQTSEACHNQRLRELGLLEGRKVRIVANHDPLICQVGESRFGIDRRLARGVMLEPIAASPAAVASPATLSGAAHPPGSTAR